MREFSVGGGKFSEWEWRIFLGKRCLLMEVHRDSGWDLETRVITAHGLGLVLKFIIYDTSLPLAIENASSRHASEGFPHEVPFRGLSSI